MPMKGTAAGNCPKGLGVVCRDLVMYILRIKIAIR